MRCCRAQQGSKHGVGTYVWPNGAAYKGEWQDGCMHGVGAFTSPDGTFYEARCPLVLSWQLCGSCYARNSRQLSSCSGASPGAQQCRTAGSEGGVHYKHDGSIT
jgi:hypothetical protein